MFFYWNKEGRLRGRDRFHRRSAFQVLSSSLYRGRVTCGTTWHAAGLTAVLSGNNTQIRMLQYAIDLFPQLEKETGMGTGEPLIPKQM